MTRTVDKTPGEARFIIINFKYSLEKKTVQKRFQNVLN